MANPSLFYCLRFVFRTFLLNFQGCHCSIIKVHLFVCAVRCSHRLCYFSTSLCACQVLFQTFFEALSNFLSRTGLCCFVSFAATLIFYQSLSGLSSTFFTFFDSVPGSSFVIPQLPVSASFDELLYFIVFAIFCQVLFQEVCRTEKEGFEPSRRC